MDKYRIKEFLEALDCMNIQTSHGNDWVKAAIQHKYRIEVDKPTRPARMPLCSGIYKIWSKLEMPSNVST